MRGKKTKPVSALGEAALALAALGKPVFPCWNNPSNEDKHKTPKVAHGFHAATTDAAWISSWWQIWPDALIGMPTGEASGIAVLDLDVKNGKDGYAAVPDWPTRSHVIAKTGSGGAHLYFNAEGAPHCTSDQIALGVDTRGNGGYVIVPPSPGYSWLNGSDLSDLPAWPDDLRPQPREKETTPQLDTMPAPGENPQAHPMQVAAALAVIPNDDLGWDEWNKIGMATWRATDGSKDGFEAWDGWSAKSGKYKHHTTVQRWRHYFRSPPTSIGAGTLFFLANQADPYWERRLEDEFERWQSSSAEPNNQGYRFFEKTRLARVNQDALVEEPTVIEEPSSISFMITAKQKDQLRQLGHDDAAIRVMTPEDAHRLLREAESTATEENVKVEEQAAPDAAKDIANDAPAMHPDTAAILAAAKRDVKPDPAKPDAITDSDPVDLWNQFDAPELPTGLLPEAIEKYARVEGDNMGCDPAGLAMTALTICAAAISDRIKLQVKEHDKNWTEAARIWTAMVGEPSARKSPILNQAARPIAKIDHRLTCQYLAEKKDYDELSSDQKKSTEPPKHLRAKIEDTTIEAAQEVLKDSPDGVLCLQDELSGFFGAMDKHSGKGAGADRAFWMKAYNGGPATYHRISRGSGYIPNLSVSLLGGIQPDAIRKVAADAIDDGLLQRMLFIVLRPAKVDQDKPRDPVVDNYNRLVDKLHRLLPRQEFGDDDVPLRFDRGAQAIRSQLAAKHNELLVSEVVNKKLATHVGKYDGVFARLCVLWHCIENVDQSPLPIKVTEDTAHRVATFLHEFIFQHAVAFYVGVLGLADEHDRLRNVAGFILARRLHKITNRDVARGDRSMRRLTDADTVKIFEQLEALGWLEQRQQTRVHVQWIVNPKVHGHFADRAKREAKRREAAREAVAKIFAARDPR